MSDNIIELSDTCSDIVCIVIDDELYMNKEHLEKEKWYPLLFYFLLFIFLIVSINSSNSSADIS